MLYAALAEHLSYDRQRRLSRLPGRDLVMLGRTSADLPGQDLQPTAGPDRRPLGRDSDKADDHSVTGRALYIDKVPEP